MPSDLSEVLDQDRDTLTGLVGSDGARMRIVAWQQKAVLEGETAPIHALMLGLRRFDTVNLAYGEAAGDSALVAVAARILRFAADELAGEWVVARMGGGNFLLAANEPCSRERWHWLAETLAESVSRPIANPAGAGTLRLWPRVALMRALKQESADAMFGRLAETLERARQETGRRVVWVDGDISIAGRSGAQLEADLLAALDRDEIEILYQPQFRADDDELVGAEALARWEHPLLGRIGAGALFAIAERADHVAQLSRHIAGRAVAEAAHWPEPLRLSLNVTPADLAVGNFADDIAAVVTGAGLCPDRLTLEITEQALLTDLDRSAQALGRLVEQGIRIALDDFGAGFCNFRYLKILPLHYLKLDRTMVDGITDDQRDLAVFRGILAMAHALELDVIAEGIETEEQRRLIAAEGCTSYQGFLRAKPMAAADFRQFAASHSPLL
ncbi:GGDEF domain-containing phosphodiesterase [Altererythrobacter fulvus]|uniref:GGDEF domain-containing phosphodiesterase n=1 Tax=Caenibius fulvus TaxID=2126012 RepID=UPI00301A1D29